VRIFQILAVSAVAICKWYPQTVGDFSPNPHQHFAPEPHWGTSIPDVAATDLSVSSLIHA